VALVLSPARLALALIFKMKQIPMVGAAYAYGTPVQLVCSPNTPLVITLAKSKAKDGETECYISSYTQMSSLGHYLALVVGAVAGIVQLL
jgi:hypothetical protein